MASPKNLTGQITRLRDRKGGFMPDASEARSAESTPPTPPRPQALKGRSLANDSFMWFSYALLAAAVVTQLGLLLWLDLL